MFEKNANHLRRDSIKMSNREIIQYDFDEFSLDVKNQKLLKNSEPVILTHKAVQTLLILVQNFGQIVEKEDIYNQLWSDSFVEDANLTQYIYILRKALGKKTDGEPYIETINKRGYRFNGLVKEVFASEIALNFDHSVNEIHSSSEDYFSELVSDDSSENHVIEKSHEQNHSVSSNQKLFKIFIPILIISGIALAGFYVYRNFVNSPRRVETAIKPIAVLPFTAIDEESVNEKLGFGMADAIITRLSKFQKIPVRPTSAIFSFSGQDKIDPVSVGRALGVDRILEGTVQRSGDRIRVNVQLISTENGTPLWAEKFDEKYTDVFAVQDLISLKVAESLSNGLSNQTRANLTGGMTNNTEAFQSYQLGVYNWNTRTKDGLSKAVNSFSRAIEIDPGYAQAYAMLADTYNMLGYYRFADRAEMNGKARQAAETALSLNDSIAEAYIALAQVQLNDPKEYGAARKSIERAIEIAPFNSTAHLRYAWILLMSGQLNQGFEQMRLAHDYDPLSPVSNGAFCQLLIFSRDYNEAVKVCEKATELSPDNSTNKLALANAYFLNGQTKDAIEAVKPDAAKKDDAEKYNAIGSLGYFYAKTNQREQAESILKTLQSKSETYPQLFNDLTLIAYSLSRKDEALNYFNNAYQKKVIQWVVFRYDPMWDEIRADKQFQAVFSFPDNNKYN